MRSIIFTCFVFCYSVTFAQDELYKLSGESFQLNEKGASHLASLPLKCWETAFPYKTGIVLLDSSFITEPKNYHPAFYGCFDWHSSVHGHWMLVKLLKQFPQLPQAAAIKEKLASHLSKENMKKELAVFKADNASFERPYGWGWFLLLQKELLGWNDPLAKQLSANLEPLAQYFSTAWIKFLQKVVYPIRVGEHTNLAFGLSFTWDYALMAKDTALQRAVKETSFKFYLKDKGCPATWEPNGYDFLSPCLEEAKLMSRLMDKTSYAIWLKQFMPALFTNPSGVFNVAVVKDRTDGKLVHLDGLNFSRAACLYEIALKLPEKSAKPLRQLAMKHLQAALPNVVSGSYAGEHWLASFAVLALLR